MEVIFTTVLVFSKLNFRKKKKRTENFLPRNKDILLKKFMKYIEISNTAVKIF
jgi:hypothetical protein